VKIQISIDRLVLDGCSLTLRETALLRASVEHELTRLIREGGLAPAMQSGGAVPQIAAPEFRASRGAPVETGARIAQSVYSGMGKS
jgi:hypothetical protein